MLCAILKGVVQVGTLFPDVCIVVSFAMLPQEWSGSVCVCVCVCGETCKKKKKNQRDRFEFYIRDCKQDTLDWEEIHSGE